jgi:cytochrome c oxidase cbb3-type subunit 1
MYVIRAVGGVLYLAGGVIMIWNLWKTVAGAGAASPARVVAAE